MFSCIMEMTETERGGEVFCIKCYEPMRKEVIRQNENCEINNTTPPIVLTVK